LQIDSFWYIDFTLFSPISLAYTYCCYSSIVKIVDKFEFCCDYIGCCSL
jgi:hypothetical protein